MSLSLYQLDESLQKLMLLALDEEEETGVMSDETRLALEEYFAKSVEKVDNIADFIRSLEALENFRKEESKRLLARSKGTQATIDRLKTGVSAFMERTGFDRIDGRRYRLTLTSPKKPNGFEAEDLSKVPGDCKRITVTLTVADWGKLRKLSEAEGIDPLKVGDEELVSDFVKTAYEADPALPGVKPLYNRYLQIK